MHSRNTKSPKREIFETVDEYSFLERLKKARALNCDPSNIGIDTYLGKKLFSNRDILLSKI